MRTIPKLGHHIAFESSAFFGDCGDPPPLSSNGGQRQDNSGQLKSGRHFKMIFLLYHGSGTQEEDLFIILKLIQYAIDIPNIVKVLRNERELLKNL